MQVAQWQPSHVAIDLSMREMSGLQVIEEFARQGCTVRIIVSSGCDIGEMNKALEHARSPGLAVCGTLAKPLSARMLRELLVDDAQERCDPQ